MSNRHCNVALFVPHAGCPHQCSFCNQRHIAGKVDPLTPEQVTAACERALATMTVDARNAEIAFFGGSFTAIPRAYMRELLAAAYPYVQSGKFSGIRLSTRPDAIDEEILSILCHHGVTTVELGAQSMNDAVLLKNGRGHTAQQVEEAARLIQQAGLQLGLQMMTGLAGDTDEGAMETARRLAALMPSCVRIYPTLVIDHTPLAAQYRRGDYRPQTLDETITLCARLLTFFEEEQGIPVIRLGLHAEQDMMAHCIAGPVHPAFRERCESRRLLQRMQNMFLDKDCVAATVFVHPSRLSQAIGQQKENISALRALGYRIQIAADAAIAPKDMRMEVIE